MKRIACIVSAFFLSASLFSCTQLENLTGKKSGDNQVDDQKKMNEVANLVAEKLVEKQKQDQLEKERHAQEIEAEVQKRMAEERAKAAETMPAAVQPVPEKVVEKIIIREGGSKPGAAATGKLSGHVRVFTDSNLSGKNMSVGFGQNFFTTIGTAFENNITSAEWEIPAGWQVSLYQHPAYDGARYTMQGSGRTGHLDGTINDKTSSIRWEKR